MECREDSFLVNDPRFILAISHQYLTKLNIAVHGYFYNFELLQFQVDNTV
jgi:hypothetical protein